MIESKTHQMEKWLGEFGRNYTDRSIFPDEAHYDKIYLERYGRTRVEFCHDWLGELPRKTRILEIGSNVGHQLRCLRKIGFTSLFGIEIQRYCVDKAKELTFGVDIIEGSAFDIPFKDGYFDLVFTNNVLIHFAPGDLPIVFDEMNRVTRRYIWGFEYYAPEISEKMYRGNTNLLWKADYAGLMLGRYPDMHLLREAKYSYRDDANNTDKAYLLEKS